LLSLVLLGEPALGVTATAGDFVISNYSTNSIIVHDGQTGNPLGTLASGINGVDGMTFLAGGDLAAVSSSDRKVYLIDPATGVNEGSLYQGTLSNPRKVLQTPNGTIWITQNSGSYQTIGVNPATGQQTAAIGGFNSGYLPVNLAYGNGVLYAAVRYTGGTYTSIQQYDPSTGASLGQLGGILPMDTEGMLIAPDGSIILTAWTNLAQSMLVRIDRNTGAILTEVSGYAANALALNSDGNLLAMQGSLYNYSLTEVNPSTLQAEAVINSDFNYYSYSIMEDMVVVPVPEPVTIVAVLMGLAGLGMYIRRRRRYSREVWQPGKGAQV
jgi:streptogramin lyase